MFNTNLPQASIGSQLTPNPIRPAHTPRDRPPPAAPVRAKASRCAHVGLTFGRQFASLCR